MLSHHMLFIHYEIPYQKDNVTTGSTLENVDCVSTYRLRIATCILTAKGASDCKSAVFTL